MTGIQQFDSVLDGLLRTRDVLSDEARWLRKEIASGDRVCLVGAAKLATRCPIGDWTKLAEEVVEQLGLELWLSQWRERGTNGGRYCTAPDFNDHPDTTHADVLALIDAAMEKARGPIGVRIAHTEILWDQPSSTRMTSRCTTTTSTHWSTWATTSPSSMASKTLRRSSLARTTSGK